MSSDVVTEAGNPYRGDVHGHTRRNAWNEGYEAGKAEAAAASAAPLREALLDILQGEPEPIVFLKDVPSAHQRRGWKNAARILAATPAPLDEAARLEVDAVWLEMDRLARHNLTPNMLTVRRWLAALRHSADASVSEPERTAQ